MAESSNSITERNMVVITFGGRGRQEFIIVGVIGFGLVLPPTSEQMPRTIYLDMSNEDNEDEAVSLTPQAGFNEFHLDATDKDGFIVLADLRNAGFKRRAVFVYKRVTPLGGRDQETVDILNKVLTDTTVPEDLRQRILDQINLITKV